ncbi:FliH/SctL family protein [Anaeromyxobacter paludicola]|uniref:Flagellar assembly protein FliH n=1 Tax=Anaeromyxobacter paludicola TaxID=2918171 RepID=A0ABM7X851_9BACT|nr:FliH/SctL family protein [Anaeromyxobacter paludicola]BDG07970.1 hypothetical protein AMPC_10830 [Anaeromyxobacter paludicola]
MAPPPPGALRRPGFLSSVPEERAVEPAPFVAHLARAPLPLRQARLQEPQEPPPPPPPPPGPSAADLAEIRREAMERVAQAVQLLKLQSERLAEQARADALEIGFQVAARILEAEVRQSPEPLFALVRSALRRAGDSRQIALRACPEDAALLQSEAGREAMGVATARVEIVPDPELARGDCVVETDYGRVDGRLATRLAEVRRAVDGALEGGGAA